jgi:hypothetical protein
VARGRGTPRRPDVVRWKEDRELGGHGCAGLTQVLVSDGVRCDLGLVHPELRGHRAVHEPQATPVVVGVLKEVEQEGMGGALAGEDGGGHAIL